MPRKQAGIPNVSIIIVNWNGKHFLRKCLTSIMRNTKYPRYGIIVVDNASTDGSIGFLQSNYPSIKIIKNSSNQGFARANNQAIRISNSEYLFMLNNDTEVMEGWLSESVMLARSDPTIGIVGSKIFFMDMRPQFPHYGLISRFVIKWVGRRDRIKEVRSIQGSAFLVKREVFDKVSLFDEGFFVYGEEGDLCYRARSAGYRVMYNSYSRVKHLKKGTSGNSPSFNYFHRTKSWQRFYLLNFSPIRLVLQIIPMMFTIVSVLVHWRLSLLIKAYAENLKDIKEIWRKRKQRKTWFL